MELKLLYESAAAVLDRLDFDSLFSGFRRYRFALYTDTAVCLDGEILPYDERFMGNTAVKYGEEYIAIWNVGADPIDDPELLASSLVHEMFHCHQYTLGETRFPSDLTLLRYPEDPDNYARKYQENCCLADAYENDDAEALGRFAYIRDLRLSAYPEMVREELKAETLEGMAEFIGLKALFCINSEKFSRKMDSYLSILRAESKLQLDIRRISYYTGTVFCLCLEKLGQTVCNDIGGELTVYEQNPIRTAEVELKPCSFIAEACAELTEDRQRKISEHMALMSFTPFEGEICGYDPMNMFRVENRIYCSHFVFLMRGGAPEMIQRPVVLELKDGSDRLMKGYY